MDYSQFKFAKVPKKLKRRKDISQKNRDSIKELFHYQCALCGRKGTQIHHILYRSEDKSKIDDIENLILLCTECHAEVHKNKHKWQPILIEIRNKKQDLKPCFLPFIR